VADVSSNFYPTRHVDPSEPGLVAAYTFADGELAQFGRYINRAATGTIYDLTTRVGTPIVGQGGGVYANDNASQWYNNSPIPVGASNFQYSGDANVSESPPGARAFFYNDQHRLYVNAGGTVFCTLNAGGTASTTAYSLLDRGTFRWDFGYDGANQWLAINGVLSDSDAVAPGSPVNTIFVGRHCTSRLAKVYNIRRTVAEARASYIRDFARRILWQWTPRDVGEGPAGGILTNSNIPFGEFFCPLGAATLKFEYSRVVNGLVLTDTNVGNNRITFPIMGNRPFFGSWLAEHIVRDPATDDSIISFDTIRGESWTLGSGASYWIRSHQSGGLWSLEWMRGGVGPLVSVTMPTPPANSRIQILGTRRVDGYFQIHARVYGGNWYSSLLASDTTYLNISYISIAPRGGYIPSLRWFQGEMNSSEICI
jgi:hypothetical protein